MIKNISMVGQLKQHSWQLLLFLLLLATGILNPVTSLHAAEVLVPEQIREIASADRNVREAMAVLRSEIATAERALPSGLAVEMAQGIATRLKALQEDVSKCITKEYKSAILALRICELSEHVLTLPYRRIPESADVRNQAQLRYAAVVKQFEGLIAASIKNEGVRFLSVHTGSLERVLTKVQNDIFFSGYGQPLNELEMAELMTILEGIVKAAGNLKPPTTSETIQLVREGRKKVIQFLARREADAIEKSKFHSRLAQWRVETAGLQTAIGEAIRSSERAETTLILQRHREESELERLDGELKKAGTLLH